MSLTADDSGVHRINSQPAFTQFQVGGVVAYASAEGPDRLSVRNHLGIPILKWTDRLESCQETKCEDRKFVKEVSDIRTSCPMIIKSPRERNTRPITISLVLSRVVQLRRGSMLFVSHQAPGPPPQPEAQFVRMFRSAERMALHLFQSSARILGAERKTFATD